MSCMEKDLIAIALELLQNEADGDVSAAKERMDLDS